MENEKPAERFRVSGPKLLKSAVIKSAISGAHRRRHATRMMVMAMMEMRQHTGY